MAKSISDKEIATLVKKLSKRADKNANALNGKCQKVEEPSQGAIEMFNEMKKRPYED